MVERDLCPRCGTPLFATMVGLSCFRCGNRRARRRAYAAAQLEGHHLTREEARVEAIVREVELFERLNREAYRTIPEPVIIRDGRVGARDILNLSRDRDVLADCERTMTTDGVAKLVETIDHLEEQENERARKLVLAHEKHEAEEWIRLERRRVARRESKRRREEWSDRDRERALDELMFRQRELERDEVMSAD